MDLSFKSCKFFINGECDLGYHDRKPHTGNCQACIAAGENTREFAERVPDAIEMAKRLANSVGSWAKSGFKLADEETFDKRMAICKACPEWDKDGMGGTGRCRKCGCSTQAKLRMASEKCPIDKW